VSTDTGHKCFIEVAAQPALVRVTLRGDATMDAAELVRGALADAHARATAAPAREVVVDFSQLEFMSSICLKTVLTWLGTVESLDPGRRYGVRLISNPSIPWQKRSIHALASFAPGLLTVDET